MSAFPNWLWTGLASIFLAVGVAGAPAAPLQPKEVAESAETRFVLFVLEDLFDSTWPVADSVGGMPADRRVGMTLAGDLDPRLDDVPNVDDTNRLSWLDEIHGDLCDPRIRNAACLQPVNVDGQHPVDVPAGRAAADLLDREAAQLELHH